MSEELKPCPFCGNSEDLTVTRINNSTGYRRIECKKCDYNRYIYGTKQDAIRKWNTRPAEEALKAEVERLKGVIAEIATTLATGAEVSEDDIFTMCKDAIGEKEVLDRYNEKLRERGRG